MSNQLIRVINPLGETVDCTYDRLGGMTGLTQYEGAKTFTTTKLYDERGSLVSQQPPAGNPTTFKYNALGLPVEATDAMGRISTMAYDESNKLIENSVGQDKIKYFYNPLGGIDKYEQWSGSTPGEHLDYDYYSTGLVKERKTGSFAVQFEYDLVGNRTKVTDPFGYAANYQYNSLHRLDEISAGDKTFDYEYYADGMIAAVNYPVTGGGSLRTEMSYDNLNRLTQLRNRLNGNTISQYNYQYDNNGNITAVTENGTETMNYTYDALNRLTGIQRSNGENIQYQYDSRGNRLYSAGITLKEENFIPGDFTYNSWEELTSFTNTDTEDTYSYQYDAEGLRSKKTGPSATVRYHLDTSGRVIAESNAGDAVTAQNIWGHKMLARKIGSSYYYYLYNGHGDVVQIINEAGNIVNSYSYDEWGNIRSKIEGISNPIKYAGEYFDEESGLYYLRARYYDPVIARFITKDSLEGDIANPLSINQYTYCYNNPLIYIDPTGYYTDYTAIDYGKEASRLGISQTGAWKDEVDQRLSDIGKIFGISDLDKVAAALGTVNGNQKSDNGITADSKPGDANRLDPIKIKKGQEIQYSPAGYSQNEFMYFNESSLDSSRIWEENKLSENTLNILGNVAALAGGGFALAAFGALAICSAPIIPIALGAASIFATIGGVVVTNQKYENDYISKERRNQENTVAAISIGLGIIGIPAPTRFLAKSALDGITLTAALVSRAFSAVTAVPSLLP